MYDVVFWDWNGTLLDDFTATFSCVNEMLDETGGSHIDFERYYSLMDTPIKKFYIGLFGTNELDFDKISQSFRTSYNKRLNKIKLMPFAKEVLSRNKDLGIKQVIITSANKKAVEQLVFQYGIRDFFEDIIGANDHKAASKIERAAQYFNEKGYNKSRAMMIGDTLHDLETANALGIDCTLITKGHQGERILKQLGCRVINNLNELSEIIK
ncbi:MAG TPA: HAD family hydrolase [Oscillospiraceae bacterium]|nr:HAD family hydrolase [Oscillospiraceae bacterium]